MSCSAVSEDKNIWMKRALEKAEESLKNGEVPVGCLFVHDNNIIATGYNTVNVTKNATRHAELNCIDQVLIYCRENDYNFMKIFNNIDVIVTVEPCVMCAAALNQLQVRSITYGCANDRFGGCKSVFDVFRAYESETIDIVGNVQGDKAMKLLKDFYKGNNPNVPEAKKSRRKK